ncbi:glucagon receptor-like isoform X3 [Amphibalanus amphitrite]|uniref:glucagon receptor-like isoform X3 n=1 Tax=Amphibalanus amphitrite TaxID=1232801 RepID=UPI001C9073F2|nr:glucagon receptor-like isoform X3 [Amphibalanus amphitrite]
MGQSPAKATPAPAASMNATLRQHMTLLEQQRLCLQANLTEPQPEGLHCPRVFDGISCWDPAPAGTTVTRPCPAYFQGFYEHNQMQKQCMPDGTWFFHGEHNRTWTNFSSCHIAPESSGHLLPDEHLTMINYSDNDLIKVWTPVIKNISRAGYGISLTSLIMAMVIFCSIRKLRSCPRTNLHMHLFVSFILKAGMWVAMDVVSYDWLGPGYSGSWVCKMVTSITQYFTMANYSWVTMEGLYLFCLIYLALFSDHSSITPYILLGWGFPICFVVPWVVVRALMEDFYCWRVNINNGFFWIIRAPTIFLILVNAVLFVCIVLILMQKLNSSISVETRRYRKLARSTLVLIPLFGFHYVVFIGLSAFMNVNRVLELIWLFGDQLFASFQGFFVAILYCFMNSEVKLELRKHWAAWRYSRASAASRGYRMNNGKSYRSTGRSSVQSTTLMEKPSEAGGQSRTPSPLVAAITAKGSSARQPCVAESIREDALEDSREPSSDIILVPPPPAPATTDPRSAASTLLVCYNGDSGGSVRIQTAPAAPAAAADHPAAGDNNAA